MITSAGIELSDVGGSLTWGAFASLIRKLPTDSATFKELHPEFAEWSSTLKTNVILADIYDVLSQINANLCAVGSRKQPHRIKPYPREWTKQKDKIGKDALPAPELETWIMDKWEEARRRHEDGKFDGTG